MFWQLRYIDEANVDNNEAAGDRSIPVLRAYTHQNLGVTYDYNENLSLQLNINNVFEDGPQNAAVATEWQNVYDNIGRYVRVSARLTP